MPSEKLEKGTLRLKNLAEKMPQTGTTTIMQNNSQAELVNNFEGGSVTEQPAPSKTDIRSVKFREWIAVVILCFVNLINYMDRFTLAGILNDIQSYYDISNDKGGLLQTAFIISYMIFAPLFGYLGDRYSRKWIMAAGVFLWSITTLVGSFMTNFWLFLLFRGLVGIGEASYSTIAPTIVSDLFVSDVRSKMLALFYFAIPVGSGLGYIVGSQMAAVTGQWQWALRLTPILGLTAVFLLIFILQDPERGQSEGSGHLENTPWLEDLVDIIQNRTFMLTTGGFTCVAFVAGALAWWGPKFIEQGIALQDNGGAGSEDTPYIFGAITMLAGIVGLSLGLVLSQRLKRRFPRADPIICGIGLAVSAPFLFAATYASTSNSILCYILLFLGQVTLNLNWAIVGDILLYVVMPTRRSTAEGFQLLFSHALGDAGSPYLIGVLSEAIIIKLNGGSESSLSKHDKDLNDFKSLQYALFTTCFVEIIGGLFFLISALYVKEDKRKVEIAIQGNSQRLLTDVLENDHIS